VADEGGLPDPGLAADEDKAAAACGGHGQVLAERGEIGPSLDKVHSRMVRLFLGHTKSFLADERGRYRARINWRWFLNLPGFRGGQNAVDAADALTCVSRWQLSDVSRGRSSGHAPDPTNG
jgi:hypothetical protein